MISISAEQALQVAMITANAGDREGALRLLQRAVAQCPTHPLLHFNLGAVYRHLERLAEAIACFQRALELGADPVSTHVRLSEVLRVAGRFDEAIASYHRILELQPGYAEIQHDLGYTLTKMGNRSEAIDYYHRALTSKPNYPAAYVNLGIALLDESRYHEAETAFRAAIALNSDDADAHINLGYVQLLLGRYDEGWKEYEWRWRSPKPFSPRGNFQAPQWNGSSAPGQTILCHAEQGIGDTIQFLRYVPLARQRAKPGRLILEVAPEFARLIAHDEDLIVRKSWDTADLPPFDQHVPLLSLPLTLGVLEPLPTDGPYLHVRNECARLGSRTRFRVGIAWAGNPGHLHDDRRSLPVEAILPILQISEIEVFSLQIPPPSHPISKLIDLSTHITDLADTAALVMELDLIISADTAVAHLAGALGRPVWTLLPSVPDWRWSLEREDTPWYPTMRLFRQRPAGDWGDVIGRVAGELRRQIAP